MKVKEISKEQAFELLEEHDGFRLSISSADETFFLPKDSEREFLETMSESLTTSKAAEVLGMSRQYLSKLLDHNVLPSFQVGSHRRINTKEVLAYKQKRKEGILAVLETTQELGGYKNSPLPQEFSREL
jgi:excisionase family DNA binding protein